MSVETMIYTALKGLVNNRVFRHPAPQEVTALPRITFFQVGGFAVNFLSPETANYKNARFQINCWGERYDDVQALARDVEDTLRVYVPLHATTLSEAVASYEEDTALHGSNQDFSFWYAD
jgi:hypothetical protein